MFLHILGSGSMFTKDTYKMISTRFPKEEHCFVGNYPDYDDYKKLDGCKIIQSASIQMLYWLYHSDYIIVHGLFNKTVIFLLVFQPWLLKKCNWVIWGADIYSHNKEKKSFIEKLIECSKCFMGPKFGYVSVLADADWEYAQMWYGVRGVHFKISYPVPASNENLTQMIIQEKDSNKNFINIQIGNSATETNQHYEALDLLAKFKDEKIKIYLPLNYGNTDYVAYGKSVIEYARSIFGDKVIPITERMEGSEYLRFLNIIDVGIFNNNRQQAMGNISQATLCGAKVYIREDTSMWEHFRKLGYTLYRIEDINEYTSIDQLTYKDPAIVKKNREIVRELHDINRKVQLWSTVFDVMKK